MTDSKAMHQTIDEHGMPPPRSDDSVSAFAAMPGQVCDPARILRATMRGARGEAYGGSAVPRVPLA